MAIQAGKLSLNLGESDDEGYSEYDDERYIEADDDSEYDDEGILDWLPGGSLLKGPQNYGSGIQGSAGGIARAQDGTSSQVLFNRRLVTEDDFKKALGRVRSDIKRNQVATGRLGKRVRVIDRKIVALIRQMKVSERNMKKKIDDASMLPMLMSTMQEPPVLDTITLGAAGTGGTQQVLGSTYKGTDDNMGTILMFSLFSGGLSGGDTGGSSSGFSGLMSSPMGIFVLMKLMKDLGK